MLVWLAIEARRIRWNEKSKGILFLKSRRWFTLLQTFVKYNMIIIYNPPVSHFRNNSKIVREMLFRFSENTLFICVCFILSVRLCGFVPELPLSIGFFNREVYNIANIRVGYLLLVIIWMLLEEVCILSPLL